MIVLDTNVLSEAVKPDPSRAVLGSFYDGNHPGGDAIWNRADAEGPPAF
jgi:hypothetical protein